MLLGYMLMWSAVMTATLGFVRLQHWRQFVGMAAVSLLIVFTAYALAAQTASSIGLDLDFFNPIAYPNLYWAQGPLGWMVLMIVPCGWLAPVIGLNTAQRWEFLAL